MCIVASGLTGKILDIIISLLLDAVKSRITNFKEQNELKKHLQDLVNWYQDYAVQHEMTIVDSQAFEDYLNNFNIIEHFLDYIIQPSEVEETYLQSRCEDVITYLRKRYAQEGRNITFDDKCCVKEVITHIFSSMRDYFTGKIKVSDRGLYYIENQINSKVDSINNTVHAIYGALQPPQHSIEKKIYQMPQNTILRCVALYQNLQEGFSLPDHSEELIEICKREKHVVLLGEAGGGKSIAIQQLAAKVYETIYYPLLYNLNRYVDESIQQIIEEEYPSKDFGKLFLIFDAFDEIEDKHKNTFARRLNTFSEKYKETIIIITSRNNFYRFSDNSEEGLFKSFKEYGIVPLCQKNIETYAVDNDISPQDFSTEINNQNLHDIAVIPFYLRELVNIYKRNNGLPEKSDIMQEIVRNRFDKDCTKYATTKEIEDYEFQIFLNLQKLAFGIQCFNTKNLSNVDYQKLFPNNDERTLIKYSGIFSKNEKNEWSFEHNIFREYLTAQFLNQLQFEDIEKLVFNRQGKIITSWINVLSFLVLIRENSDLVDLLIEKDPEILIQFETSRIDEATRADLVIKLLDGFSQKNVWITHGLNSAERVAKFGQSKKLCEYLLDQISTQSKFRALSNALIVLSEFTNLYGMDKQVQQILFDCLRSHDIRNYEKGRALAAIVSLGLSSDVITLYLADHFQDDAEGFYVLQVLRYLKSAHLCEAHIDYFIEAFKLAEKNREDQYGIRFEVLNAFCEVHDSACLCKIISTIAQRHDIFSIDHEFSEKIISNAIAAYNQGNTVLLDTVIGAFRESAFQHNGFSKECITFFEKTGTKTVAFMKIAEDKSEEQKLWAGYLLKALGDADCYECLLAEYKNDPQRYKELVNELASRFHFDDPWYKDYKAALLERGISLPKETQYFDHDAAREEGYQIYFNALFDKSEYCSLVEKLVVKSGNKKITFSELKNFRFDFFEYSSRPKFVESSTLRQIYYNLGTDDDSNNRIVLDAILHVENWKRFIARQAYKILRHDNKITISDCQKEYFQAYCNELLACMDFSKDFSDNDTGGITYTYAGLYFIFFSDFFDFHYEKDIYLKMLLVPPRFFKKQEEIGYSKIPQYICNHLSEAEIADQIMHNLLEDNLCLDTLEMYIQFCKDRHLDAALQKAEDICLNAALASWHKRHALDYINDIKGYEYIYDRFLGTEDKDLFEHIVNITIGYRDFRLKERLEQVSRDSPSEQKFIGELIYLNSAYGLQCFYDQMKSSMKSTDFVYSMSYSSPLESLSVINDIGLLDRLGDMRILRFNPGFEDSDVFRLYNSLYKAYVNLADNDFEAVTDHLQSVVQSDCISEEERSFCNTVLIYIEQLYNQRSGIEWTIPKIKTLWDKVNV